ncbi:50S ribosomal protein L32e [Methanocella arvoryzae]|uniref:Large ribosomal subunit protein eL32 n=1 Tax=Methanocella arvoryzae (strain DSM 22066 / NBRC 105507 / MRE50) TaxID=351160 RepID=Q0W1X1_METAR|nr:50S ribosomal protein L32e [Methanocella arvoryzae]CAJ37622.1 putative 50S ribosomal protein L32E [Methanocella arvoryzae MRE50]
MADDKKKAVKKTAEKKAADATTQKASKKATKEEAVEQTQAVEAKAETKAAEKTAESKKLKGTRKEAVKAAAPSVKPRPVARPVEPSTLELDPETKRLLAARKSNKASLPSFNRIDSHKKIKLSASWRRPRGHHSQFRRGKKAKGAKVKIGYGSPAEVNGFHPSGYQEVLVHRPEDVKGIAKTQAIRIGGTVGRKKQLEIEKIAKEQNIKVLNPLNTFEGAQ